MMKLVLVASFLALAAALPYQRDNIVGKSSGQGDPVKIIFGALINLNQGIESLNQRVDELEGQIEEIQSHLSGEQDVTDGSGNQEPLVGQEPVRSDDTAVRMLLQKLESRLAEKKREQKQFK